MTTAAKKGTGQAPKPLQSGLGLDSMGDLDAPASAAKGGGPLELDIELIDEDPKQQRTANNPGFTDERLRE